MRGYFGIGIEHTKTEANVGTLWRSANLMGSSFIFTIGKRYKKQCTDTMSSEKHIPLYHFLTIDELNIPYGCRIVGVELDQKAKPIKSYIHPDRAIYILGAEDCGLSKNILSRVHDIIVLPGEYSMNVAVAGSIVMYDRITKGSK